MRYYIIAGEASGDLHASNLVRELNLLDDNADFKGFGGDLMQNQGVELTKHYKDMAFMGFVEVAANLRSIFRNLKTCKKDITTYSPDVLILVDFPGFNLKIADFAKKKGIKVFYYISPKIWAWNQKRALKIKRSVDRMFCILPFEVDFYKKWDMQVDYVGNPLMDAIETHEYSKDFKAENKLPNKPIIALLPGSRKQEIDKILPVMIDATTQFITHQTVIAGAPSFDASYYRQYLGDKDIPVIFNQTYDLLKQADAALVTSGTATLETALMNVPQVVMYKANALSVAIARKLVKIKFISLVNLIAGKELVKELIQQDCSPTKTSDELTLLLNDTNYRQKMLGNYKQLAQVVGGPGASQRAAQKMMEYLQ